jgi:aminobenzoyl-glutamate transport protein
MSEPRSAQTSRAPAAGGLARALDWIERTGNRLPHPVTLFVLLAVGVLVASAVVSALGVTVVHPRDGSTIAAVNLLTRDGLRRLFTEAVRNFTGFAPLGTVLVTMLGIGVAEGSGLFGVALRALVAAIPRGLLTATVVFAGINANQAADAGIIVLPPLAALVFAAAGRHPLAGIAAAFAGVAGGFSANLLPSTLDVLLAGLTQEAVDASKLLPGYTVHILGNYYFMVAATPLLTLVGTWITERIVEPRLGPWQGAADRDGGIGEAERRGLWAAGLAAAAMVALLVTLALAPFSPLRGEGATALERLKPFFDSLVVLIMAVFFVPGLAYGIAAGTIRNDHDVARLTGEAMATMGTYIVLAFAAAQFVSTFAWSNLGAMLAIAGADGLRAMGLGGGPLIVGLVGFSAFINLFTASSSAKWAFMGPVFVPMFALLGFSPEGTQAVYRVGDSCTNIITPVMPYMPFILAYVQRYAPRAGVGSIIAMMLPYSVAFLVLWTVLLLLFYGFGWPIGPGVHLRMG